MTQFLVRVAFNALALWVASWVLPGMEINASATTDAVSGAGAGEGSNVIGVILAYLFIGLIFGLINSLVRPIVSILSLPVTILTLGLFTLVINAAMLNLTAWVSGYTPVHLTIDSFFWTAVLGALIISVVSMLTGQMGRSRR